METTIANEVSEVRPAGDHKHFIVYTESLEVERALSRLDHCVPLGTYCNQRGSKFAQDLMFENNQRGQVEKLLEKMANSSV